MKRMTIVASLVAMFVFTSISAFGADKVKGMINGRAGDTFTVTGSQGTTTVVLTDTTKVQDKRGMFGWDRTEMGETVLIPGLKVEVSGTADEKGQIVAKKVIVDGDDVESSQMIAAGLQPTADQVIEHEKQLLENQKQHGAYQEQIAAHVEDNNQQLAAHKQMIEQNISETTANTQRFTALDDYDVKDQATVKFASGSARIPKAYLEQLHQLAQNALGTPGYLIEVTGYADAQGSAAMNTVLSENRAKAVITYLMQQGGVPVRNIVAPGAMGEYGPASTNETKAGRAENRRVEVKVLVNKGIAGGTT